MYSSTPRLVIASISSGSGKTLIASGLMAALSKRGVRVQGFKVGPDFIDPTYHYGATGTKSRNLDSWLLPKSKILELFQRQMESSDLGIVEGVMGLYDGSRNEDDTGSTAEMARLLKAPIVLVIDVWGMARSSAAIVAGCKSLDKRVNILGVILNRVAGDKHTKLCKDAIEMGTGVKVIGSVPRSQVMVLPERHLGLVPVPENLEITESIKKISRIIEDNVDIEEVVSIGNSAPPLKTPIRKEVKTLRKKVPIGIAYDKAFNFYYQDALDTLAFHGAELKTFSPLYDSNIPEVSGLYIGGGFPEVLARELGKNQSMRKSIKKKSQEGMPILAECGGLMYLTKSIIDLNEKTHPMVGILDSKTRMTGKLTLNYTEGRTVIASPISRVGDLVKGHEFHHSKLEDVPADARFAFEMRRGSGIKNRKDGLLEYSTLAQYMHMHMAGSPGKASRFLQACSKYAKK